MEEQLNELKTRLQEIYDLQGAASLLSWDQSTYMPRGGATARGRQLAILQRIIQEKFTDPEIGRLLDKLEPQADQLEYDSDAAGLIRATRRLYDHAVQIPPDFMGKLVEHWTETYSLWTAARPDSDFEKVRPNLEKNLELSRQAAEFFDGYDHIADPLIAESEYGMTTAEIRRVFGELREALVPLVKAVTEQEPADASCLYGDFPLDKQFAFVEPIIEKFGYDFQRGRRDLTHHPFAVKFSIGDVRITTRGTDSHLGDAIFATMHEAGHGMYEQGLHPNFEGTTLARGTSSGVHESQSRTWENIVGRGRAMWEYYYPQLQATFPDQLNDVPLDVFYKAINKVAPSLIRTAADELTYNLHIMIRFDLEIDMLEGKLAIKDLPDAWNARYESDLGVIPPDHKDGCMQDIHWFAGTIGGSFQGYTLGNIMSLQFYNAALDAHPSIPDEIRQGEFSTLHSFMKENIYQHGRKYTANELLKRLTGGPLSVQPLVNYLTEKYTSLYDVTM